MIVDCLKLLLKDFTKSLNTFVSRARMILKAQSYAAVVEAPIVKIGRLAISHIKDRMNMSPILEIKANTGFSMLKIFNAILPFRIKPAPRLIE